MIDKVLNKFENFIEKKFSFESSIDGYDDHHLLKGKKDALRRLNKFKNSNISIKTSDLEDLDKSISIVNRHTTYLYIDCNHIQINNSLFKINYGKFCLSDVGKKLIPVSYTLKNQFLVEKKILIVKNNCYYCPVVADRFIDTADFESLYNNYLDEYLSYTIKNVKKSKIILISPGPADNFPKPCLDKMVELIDKLTALQHLKNFQ